MKFTLLLMFFSSYVYANKMLDAYNLSLEKDPDVLNTNLSDQKNHYHLKKAFSFLFPKVTASVNLSPKNWNEPPAPNSTLNFSIRQEIFNYGSLSSLSLEKKMFLIKELEIIGKKQNHIIKISRSYLLLLQAELELQSALTNSKSNLSTYNQASRKFEVGLEKLSSLNTSRASYIGSKSRILETTNKLLSRMSLLKSYTGISQTEIAFLDEDKFHLEDLKHGLDHWLALARENNPDYLASKIRVEVARSSISQSNSKFMPSVYLNAGFRKDISDGLDKQDFNRTIGIGVSMSLFNGFSDFYDNKVLRIGLLESKNNQIKQLYSLNKEVESTFFNVSFHLNNVLQKREELKAQQSALDALEVEFQSGSSTITDVLVARSQYYNTFANLNISKHSYVSSVLSLYKVCGILSVDHLVYFDSMLSNDVVKVSSV